MQTTNRRKVPGKRSPSKPLDWNRNRRNKSRSSPPSTTTATGTTVPSYEDDVLQGDDSYSDLPPPPSQRQPLAPPKRHRNPRSRPARAARPRIPRIGSDSSVSSSSSASSAGPWKSLAPAEAAEVSSTFSSPPKRSRPVAPRRKKKTARVPAGEPVQAVIPRAPRNIAAAKVGRDQEYDDDDTEVDGVMPLVMPPQPEKLVAGGKKAKLAVELKLNLEIEVQLKVRIQGDLTLELFN